MFIQTLKTDRLVIEPITIDDKNFIFELVNTVGWLKFIGNRNISSDTDAAAYIQKIIDNKNAAYWTVRLNDTRTPIGIVTIIKRDYLEHQDIGFAFLPGFTNHGYAYEATNAVLNDVASDSIASTILAVTIPENIDSIRLLEKLGLHFDKEIELDDEKLRIYKIDTTGT